MFDIVFIFLTAAVILLYFFSHVFSHKFDPFAPVWLYLLGYIQIYIIQALSYHDWAISVRGQALVAAANLRALWALLWFLMTYHLQIGRRIAQALPMPAHGWSSMSVTVLSPVLILWGLYCAGIMYRTGAEGADHASPEELLVRSFPFVMVVAAILLIITARNSQSLQPVFLTAGLTTGLAYITIWMFNGKRSHSLIGVLSTVCAFYISRQRRPSWPVLVATCLVGSMVVALAIGWRNNADYDFSLAGFSQYLAAFKPEKVLESLNIQSSDTDLAYRTYETEEYGAFLLMMDTVPSKADYDYGLNYLRTFTTMIPRILWPNKPLFGREQWIAAWIAGSELDRDVTFTSPSIGILGATQLNGGCVGTLAVIGCLAIFLRTAYEYFRLHASVPWTQFWWSIFFYNAWFMVVCDDPMVWFYYNWGFTTFPIVILFWLLHRPFRRSVR